MLGADVSISLLVLVLVSKRSSCLGVCVVLRTTVQCEAVYLVACVDVRVHIRLVVNGNGVKKVRLILCTRVCAVCACVGVSACTCAQVDVRVRVRVCACLSTCVGV